jgi:hypothetical protein
MSLLLLQWLCKGSIEDSQSSGGSSSLLHCTQSYQILEKGKEKVKNGIVNAIIAVVVLGLLLAGTMSGAFAKFFVALGN